MPVAAPVAALLGLGFAAACAPGLASPWNPSPEVLAQPAPDSFVVEFDTSEGPFEVTLYREWSPLGVDRAYHLFSNNFYAGARIYRVEAGFVAQFGFTGRQQLDSMWLDRNIGDEPVVGSNVRGTLSFARGGPESRTFQLFFNLKDNSRLDTAVAGGVEGYPPIGRIGTGLQVVDGFYSAYRPRPPRQDSIRKYGNDYLRRNYPQLDSIVGTRVIWESSALPGNDR